MIKKILFKKTTILERIILFCFSFFFLFIQVIGYNCQKYDSSRLFDLKTYIFIIFVPLFYYIFKFLFKFPYKYKSKDQEINSKKVFFTAFILIFLAWIPIIISFYPNNFAFDASTQVRMIMYNSLSTYHPVIHTIFLGGLVKLSYLLFGTYTIGNFMYGIIQATIMNLIFSYCILFLVKERAPRWLVILSTVLFMFLPTHSVLAISTTKDIIFSGLILLLVIKFYYFVTDEKYLDNNKNLISLISVILLSLMFRNNMLYALIIFSVFFIIIFRKKWKQIMVILLIPILIYEAYNLTLTKLFKVEKGPGVEAFSVIIQQLARVYNKEDLTVSEKEQVSALYKNDSLSRYNSQISDPVKSEFDSGVLFSNISSYMKLYLNLGIKYPLTYIDSFLVNNYGYFYFFDKLPISGTKTYIWVNCMGKDESFSCVDDCNNNFIYNLYDDLLEKANYQKVPILNIFMNIGFNVFVMFYTLFFLLYKKKYKLCLPILLLLSLFITNLLGPVALMRYVYPIFVCLPFMLFLIFKTLSIKNS